MDRVKLNEINIDAACNEADAYLESKKAERSERLRTRLALEEILLQYKSAFGSDAEFTVDYSGGIAKCRIRLTVPGEQLDPLASSDDGSDEEQFMRNALTRMGQLPKWKYKRGANVISFSAEKKNLPDWQKLITAIAAALILGFATRMLPPDISTVLQQSIIAPLLETFLGFLNAVAGPMIFLSVVWGIYSIGDVSTFSEVGRHICVRFLVFLCAATLVISLISLPFYSLKTGLAQGGSQFSELYRMVLDIIPDNLFTPFSRGNTLQILFVGIIVGITMLVTGKDMQSVADLSEQLGYIVNGIMSFISGLVPFFVFGSLFNIVASSEVSSLAAGGKFFAGALAGCLLLMVFHTVVCCIRMRISPPDLWKRTLSTFIISITTASSSAAFADNIKTCTDKLGVSPRLANFGVPFGQILYKPGVAVLFWFAAVSVAESGGVEVSAVWLVTAIAVCTVLSAAAPPVPGGMTASFTILFAQLGLPVSDLAIILSLTSILDFVVTATNIYSGQCLLAVTSKGLEK